MNLGGKWVEGIQPRSGVADAAAISLSARLAPVAHWLALAAGKGEQDIEFVHQLRVSTRRAAAALVLYRDFVASGKRRWLEKRLKKIRKAAGAARDLDVLALRLRNEFGDDPGAEALLATLASARADAQPPIRKIYDRIREKERFTRKSYRLVEDTRVRGEEGARGSDADRFEAWAQAELREAGRRFFNAMPHDMGDVAALHEFRIEAKALRYAMELLAPAFGPEMRKTHYRVVEEVQERLGEINDLAAGAIRLRQAVKGIDDPAGEALLATIAERDEAARIEKVAAFGKWWSPARASRLKDSLVGPGRNSKVESEESS